MNDRDIQILNILRDLKNQIQEARGILIRSDSTKSTSVEHHQDEHDDYKMNLTSEELNILLSAFSTEATTAEQADSTPPDELQTFKAEFLEFQEQTLTDLEGLRQSITILSEMWGRHEMEIRKAAPEKPRMDGISAKSRGEGL